MADEFTITMPGNKPVRVVFDGDPSVKLNYGIGVSISFEGTDEFTCHLFVSCSPGLSSSASAIFLEVYDKNTTGWDLKDSENSISPGTKFNLTTDLASTSDYNDAGVINCRIYEGAP